MKNSAILPVPKIENDFYDWYARHEEKKELARSNRYDLIFIGDSITHLFEGDPAFKSHGAAVWKEYYMHRKALNLGFGWDRTQNVLWRLQNGEFKNQSPKLVVLLIGTNNLTTTENAKANTPAEICEGINAITSLINKYSSKTHILVLGLLPRADRENSLRFLITDINIRLQEMYSRKVGFDFMDIGPLFLDGTDNIIVNRMPDLVHPSETGYVEWAQAIEPVVQEHVNH